MACFSCAYADFYSCASTAFLCKIYLFFPEYFKGNAQSSCNSCDRCIVVDLSSYCLRFCTERLWSIIPSSARPFYWQSSADGCLNHGRGTAWHSGCTIKNKSFSPSGSSWVRDVRTHYSDALSIPNCVATFWRNPFVSRTCCSMGLA